jgi:hypothetical protein
MATRKRNDLISALSEMVESQFRHLLHLFIGYAAQSAAATARPHGTSPRGRRRNLGRSTGRGT